jgi:protein-disulfide isomerase
MVDIGSRETHATARSWRSRLEVGTTLAMLVAAVVLVWYGTADRLAAKPPSMEIAIPSDPVSLAGARVAGSPSAAIILGIFSDFECPYCARFESGVLPTLRERYVTPGRVALAFWNYPLSIHPNAKPAARAGECAPSHAQFWELHDAFFANPKQLATPDLEAAADAARIDLDRFRSCMSDEPSLAAVESDIALAKQLGIKGTPAFLIGRRNGDALVVLHTISGGKPPEEFTAALDKALEGGR